MKIAICDVCHYKENKQEVATKRVGMQRKMNKRVMSSFYIDVCDKHQNFVKQYKTIDALQDAYIKMCRTK